MANTSSDDARTEESRNESDQFSWNTLDAGVLNGLPMRSIVSLISHDGSENDEEKRETAKEIPYFTKISNNGNEVLVLRPLHSHKDQDYKQIQCTRLLLKSEGMAAETHTQTIEIPQQLPSLSIRPEHSSVGKPAPISCTSNLRFLRIGVHLFQASPSGEFLAYNGPEGLSNELLIDKIDANDRYLVLASRWKVPEADHTAETENAHVQDNQIGNTNFQPNTLSSNINESSSQKPETDTKSPKTTRSNSITSNNSSASSLASLEIKETASDIFDEEEEPVKLDSESDMSSNETNSARESYSEASTATQSDEIDDSDEDDNKELSDFSSEPELKIDDELDVDFESDLEKLSEDNLETECPVDSETDLSDASSDELFDKMQKSSNEKCGNWSSEADDEDFQSSYDSGYENSEDSNESDYGSSDYEDDEGDDDDDDDSDDENEGGTGFADFVNGPGTSRSTRKSPAHQRQKLEIFDTLSQSESGSGKPVSIFHFDHAIPQKLFSSGPILHPSAPLAVWPLDGTRLLFANFTENTYFIQHPLRSLSSIPRAKQSAAVEICSVQCKFSACGGYLYVAVLEMETKKVDEPKPPSITEPAQEPNGQESNEQPSLSNIPETPNASSNPDRDPKKHKRNLRSLTLHIATHRLSSTKTARAPPRLIFRINAPLGPLSEDVQDLSQLYNIIWTDSYAYIVQRQRNAKQEPRIMRIPLFHAQAQASS